MKTLPRDGKTKTGGIARWTGHRSCQLLCLAALFGFGPLAGAQQPPAPAESEELALPVSEWIRENLDPDALAVLGDVDQERVETLFRELLRRFDANDIYDLASARDAAVRLLPVLKQFEEVQPYASWLESHLDYLDAAETFRRQVKVLPAEPDRPRAVPLPPPTAEAQQSFWQRKVHSRPVPVAARDVVPRLKSVFLAHGVPAELVWIAEVESAFDPRARSPKGALGMFQLMPVTARSLGLVTEPADERLDPLKSASAAAKYLRRLHGRFGDWRLALAAYNAGETRLANILSKTRAHGFYAVAPKLPAETQLYVPRVEATVRKREGVSLLGLRRPAG